MTRKNLPALSEFKYANDSDLPYEQSLTEFEVRGLKTEYNFADGHAYNEPHQKLQTILSDINDVWGYARSHSIPAIEEEFKVALGELIESPTLQAWPHYSIFPTASNSIDAVGAWLKMRNLTVGLLEPVFDNLHLILKRRDVSIYPINEELLLDLEHLELIISQQKLGALFIVSPNNPTGFYLNNVQFRDLCQLCASKNVTLIVDRTFRFYSKAGFDDYVLMDRCGVDFITIEDTGKTWPTLDLKVSLMVYSAALSKDLRLLYEEIFLCSSNFTVALLTRMIRETASVGLKQILWDEVYCRANLMKSAFAGTEFEISNYDTKVQLPFLWINVSCAGIDDMTVINKFQEQGVSMLPGRYFYWNSLAQNIGYVRLSLMRPRKVFTRGVAAIKQICNAKFSNDSGPRALLYHV